jgi:nucleoside-diphosphate-sugar epimerase
VADLVNLSEPSSRRSFEMKVLVAGATGALGRQIVPRLINAGHEVAGTTTTPAKERQLREAGATSFVVDALQASSVARAVTAFEPDAIIHELTALSSLDIRQFEKSFALTNRLRIEAPTTSWRPVGRSAFAAS